MIPLQQCKKLGGEVETTYSGHNLSEQTEIQTWSVFYDTQ